MSYIHKTQCRVCKGRDLVRFLSLGEHPPVDNFTDREHLDAEKRYPLDVYFCNTCNLVQLLDVVTQEELFHGNYAYFSSASAPLVEHFKSYAEDIKRDFLQKNDLVVDIGSNDGILLQFLTDTCRVLGIEPSANVAEVARGKGVETIDGFFTMEKMFESKDKIMKISFANSELNFVLKDGLLISYDLATKSNPKQTNIVSISDTTSVCLP